MILVTGGAGYIGSHCVLELLKQGYEVVIFDNLSTGHVETVEKLQNLNFKGKVIDFINGDLTKKNDIDSCFNRYKFDSVIHFAAYSLVGESVTNPIKYYYNNVFGSLNLLSSMVENNVMKIVFSSTAATYGEPEYIPIDENHPQKPINTYGNTKLTVERIMDDFDKAYGLKSVRLRYFNVAGADESSLIGEWHEPESHLIPNILKSTFDGGKTFTIFGDTYGTKDGTCIRDYINISDLIDAHILALKYLDKGGKTNFFNLGTKSGDSVKDVFNECEKVTGKKIPVSIAEKRAGDPCSLIADNSKANEVLGWIPKRTLNDSIKTAYAWEKNLQKYLCK